MEIKIKTLDDSEIILTNNELNNPNYIDLIIKEANTYHERTVPVNELYSALLSFKELQNE